MCTMFQWTNQLSDVVRDERKSPAQTNTAALRYEKKNWAKLVLHCMQSFVLSTVHGLFDDGFPFACFLYYVGRVRNLAARKEHFSRVR